MAGRSNTIKDIRSKIKHENATLGAGTASSSFSSARQQVPHVGDIFGHHPGSASVSSLSGFTPSTVPGGQPQQGYSSSYAGPQPSNVSLAPSDSVSNIYGRSSHARTDTSASIDYQQQNRQQPFYGQVHRPNSPTAQSTASFALNTSGSSTPAVAPQYGSPSRLDSSGAVPSSPTRPVRSGRRPQQAPPVTFGENGIGHERSPSAAQRPKLQIPPAPSSRTTSHPSSPVRGTSRDLLASSRAQGSHSKQPSQSSLSSQHLATPPSDRHTRSARLMDQVARGGTPSSQLDSEYEEDLYGGISPVDPPSNEQAGLYSNARSNQLSVPGKRPERDPRRASGAPLGSLTPDEEPAALGSVLSALTSAARKRQAARIMRGTTAEEESRRRRTEKKISDVTDQRRRPITDYMDRSDPATFREINAVLRKINAEWPFAADDNFNSVTLALSMLDNSSLGSNRIEFENTKHLIETSLQGTVNDHYESFASAITLHNSVLQSLTAAQGSVSGARRRLRDSREALGAKRADLIQMWQRSQAVKESLRLLDLIEHLKAIPDRLESLMSEKQFLQAVNLLVRSLKTIDKSEIVEVGATNDLRAYLKGQEQAMLEILIEELHNHLYLKSYFCDSRWKTYVPEQDDLPVVNSGSDYAQPDKTDSKSSSKMVSEASDSADKELQLHKYLQSLRSRPMFDPNLAGDIPETELMSAPAVSALTGELNEYASGNRYSSADGANGSSNNDVARNPETDSFLYIEMLLESLSRLGKLGAALDTVSQRLAIEVHQLIDATIDEVDARNEPLRRFSIALRPESMLLASSTALARSFNDLEPQSSSARSSFNLVAAKRPVSTMLRISAGESSALQRDGEMMRDLFWTLFSKLDAVLQGHRVVHEVAGMIAGRAGFKDELASRKISGAGSLIEVWKPIQHEVRTLLHDYLMDDEESVLSRNAIISVNEIIRDQRYGRDRAKQLFKLADPGSKRITTARRDNALLRRHELAIAEALKASVPGLVNSRETKLTDYSNSRSQVIVSAPLSATRKPEDMYTGAGHRLLVKPDAFNISVLFQPALSFIERVSAVMPAEAAGETSKGFSAFLEEFVQDVFLPQLEEKVQTLFFGATGHAGAFAEDPTSRSGQQSVNDTGSGLSRPLVKSASNVILLLDSLYSMLATTPFHRESYSRLVVTTIVQYYQKCGESFRDLVSADATTASGSPLSPPNGSTKASKSDSKGDAASNALGGRYVLSASWAQRPELYACLSEMLSLNITSERRNELQAQETRFEMALIASRPAFGVHDLTTSRKKLLALGCLQHSLEWFLLSIGRLQPVAVADKGNRDSSGSAVDEVLKRSKRPEARLNFVGSVDLVRSASSASTSSRTKIPAAASDATAPVAAGTGLPLPLSPDLFARYQALPKVYQQLSLLIQATLRLEARLRVITYLQLSISEVSYVVNDTAIEPAPHIVDLNAELASLDDILNATLLPETKGAVFAGISQLMDSLLVASVHKIKAINRDGVTKMIRNILALQQNLKNILPPAASAGAAEEVSFERSKKFFELLYSKTPDELLGNMKHFKQRGAATMHGVGFAEFQAILHLQLGIANGASSGTDGVDKVVANAGTTVDQPGTAPLSRQKLNEYLIELHDVAGGESDDD